MKPPHTSRVVELRIPGQLGYEKVVREAGATVARRLGFDDEHVADIKLAVAEACTNAISYGCLANPQLRVVVRFTSHPDVLDIVVHDPGLGDPPPDELTKGNLKDILKQIMKGERPPGGMGLLIISELMDIAEFIVNDFEGGNQFHMVIRKPHQSDSNEIAKSNEGEYIQ
jgi:serine/threonine-protein kinase RsbW